MRIIAGAIALLTLSASAHAQVVTATEWVSVDKQKQLMRKINGRWWTPDNREIYPPLKKSMISFWEIDSKPGVCVFYHHRPFDMRRAENLHLFMKASEVEAILGPANRTFPMGPSRSGEFTDGFWYYYATDGTSLNVRMMDGELGEAEYKRRGVEDRPVESVNRDLAGRSIYKLRAQRASERPSPYARPSARQAQVSYVDRAPEPVAPIEKRIVSKEAFEAIKTGESKQDVLDKLGKPSYSSSVVSGDGFRESLTYHLSESETVIIRILDGKVVVVP